MSARFRSGTPRFWGISRSIHKGINSSSNTELSLGIVVELKKLLRLKSMTLILTTKIVIVYQIIQGIHISLKLNFNINN